MQLPVKESSGDPYLTWEKVDGAEKYEVWCENGGEMRLLYTTRGDHLTHGSAVPGRTYRYQVRAVGGAFGQELSCVCTCARPDVRLTIHSGDPELRWSAVKGAEKYEVLCSVNGRGYQHLLTVGGTRLHHGSARAGSTYKYRVRALCRTSEGNSALSYTDTAHL